MTALQQMRGRWRTAGRCLALVALVVPAALLMPAAVVAAGNGPRPAEAQASGAVDAETVLARGIEAIGPRLDERVVEALGRIDGTGRQLLALRSYLRSGDRLAERWSWTQQQITAYEGSPEHRDLLAEIDRVRVAFTRENPGFELWVNPQVRSLDRQLESWNTNESVAAAAANLHAAALGLVAGPATATIATDWDAAGWSAKLDAAVRAATRRFVGPLASPREPWHYTYEPEAVAAQ